MSWMFGAEETNAVREFRVSYRGEWTVVLGDVTCASGVRTATFSAAFEGEKGTPHTDLGTLWSPFTYDESLAYTESDEGVTFVLPSIVSGAYASFERCGTAPEVEVLTEEPGRNPCIDTATFVAGVGLEQRVFSCYYGMGWSESSDFQRR